jgi:sialate O-acetylesterase
MKSSIAVSMRSLGLLLCSGLCLHAAEPATAAGQAQDSVKALTLEARLARPFGDHAIFQQNMPIPVWGWSLPGAEVTVAFGHQKQSALAGNDGRWRVTLDPLPADKLTSVHEAPAGHSLTITTRLGGKEAIKSLGNILIGEVWLCSGQSNMAGVFGRAPYPPDSLTEANYPALRNLEAQWTISTPETAGRFYRAAFCFARKLQSELMVPVGLMAAAVAGTQIESWMIRPPENVKLPNPKVVSERGTGKNYEEKIAPLVGFGMRGAIWYQGEGNVKDGRTYLPKMQSLIGDWRKIWGQGDFPFYFVQIASMGESPTNQPAGGDGRAEIRNAQLQALAITNTGMAVTIDIGAAKEHPINKYDVGLRLARWALYSDYGRKDLVPSGPIYKACKAEGRSIRVTFDHAQNGLMLARKDGYLPPVPTPDAAMPWLSLQDKDGAWHWADGKIDGSDLIVSSREVSEPAAVRYAYSQNPVGCNLYNKDGLPASPFSTNGY